MFHVDTSFNSYVYMISWDSTSKSKNGVYFTVHCLDPEIWTTGFGNRWYTPLKFL